MRYLGGKTRIGKEISQVLMKYGPPDQVNSYCEPFCGALGVMIHMVDKGYKKTKAYDKCKDLILLWKEVKAGTFKYPKNVSERTWKRYKRDPTPSAMRAFVGFGCSFGGTWFEGYIGNYDSTSVKASIRGLYKKEEYVKKITHIGHKDYNKINLKGYLIYCDPPYKNTRGYRASGKFNSEEFWDIVRQWSKNNIVIVSEFTAPKDFKCIWKKNRKISVNTINNKENYKVCEKLFIHKSLVRKRFVGPKVQAKRKP